MLVTGLRKRNGLLSEAKKSKNSQNSKWNQRDKFKSHTHNYLCKSIQQTKWDINLTITGKKIAQPWEKENYKKCSSYTRKSRMSVSLLSLKNGGKVCLSLLVRNKDRTWSTACTKVSGWSFPVRIVRICEYILCQVFFWSQILEWCIWQSGCSVGQ